MALLIRYLSAPTTAFGISASDQGEIVAAGIRFIDEKFSGGLASNFIGWDRTPSATDVLIHVCCKTSDAGLFSAGTSSDVGGMTEVSSVENVATGRFIPQSGYSEVWAFQLLDEFSLDLTDASGRSNFGRITAIVAIHEGMHMKVESFEQVSNSRFDLHVHGGGGVAAKNSGIFMENGVYTSTIDSTHRSFIQKHFGKSLKQVIRTPAP